MEVGGKRCLSNLLSSTLRFGSDNDSGVYCHSCELRGRTIKADGYCQNCREHLCEHCINTHGRDITSRHHVVNRMLGAPTIDVAEDKIPKCTTHTNEEMKLFCRAHEQLGCVICMTLSHKICEIDYIPDVSKDFPKSDFYKGFEENINSLKERCALGISRIEANIAEVEETYERTISEIETTRKEIIENLDKFENSLKEEVEEYKKKNIEEMQSVRKAYDSIISKMAHIENSAKKLRRDDKYNQLFCEVQNSVTEVTEGLSQAYELSTRLSVQVCDFHKSGALSTALTPETMFGVVDTKEKELGPCSSPEKIYDKPVSHINIKGKDDKKTCYATGLAFLSSDQLVVADKANKSVKIVDISCNKMISEIKLSSSPRDVTVIPPDQLAVTLRDEKKIQVLATCSGLSKVEDIKTDGKCRGITFDNGHLIVTFDGLPDHKAQEMSLKGEVLRYFYTTHDEKIFLAEPKCVGLSPDRTHLYFTDFTKMSIIRVSQSRKVTTTEWKANYMGLAISRGGSIYACGKDDNSVFQYTDDLSAKSVVLNSDDGIRGPIGLAICHKTNMLAVSCGSGKADMCDNVHIYKIKRD